MKKILICLQIFAVLTAHAQTSTLEEQSDSAQVVYLDSIAVDVVQLPTSTATGTPYGKKVTQQIGPSGGTITSVDGKIQLNFPDGALKEMTTISIQPTTHHLPNAGKNGYHFEPSGIHFAKPVQLVLRYTDEEADACPAFFMYMALQSKNGEWEYLDYVDWDSASKTLQGSISHFSDFVNGHEVELFPVEETELKVGGESERFNLNIMDRSKDPKKKLNTSDEDDLPQLPKLLDKEDKHVKWSVATKGKGSPGTIKPNNGSQIFADYKTPSKLPSSGEVTVTLNVNIVMLVETIRRAGVGKVGFKKGFIKEQNYKTTNVASFKRTIKLYDAYQISVIHNFHADGPVNLGDGELADSANCIVYVYPNLVKIDKDKIKNSPPQLIKDGGYVGGENWPGAKKYRPKLNIDINGAEGSVHLTGDISNVKVSQDHPPEVYFELAQKKELVLCRAQYVMKGIAGPIEQLMYKPKPIEINFIANGQPQEPTIYLGGATNKYRLIVKRYSE